MEERINEEKEIAKEWRDICLAEATYAKGRSNKLSDEYCKNLLQISSIIFGIATAFTGQITQQTFSVKLFFISGLITLIFSLIFGITNTHLRETFWEEVVATSHRRTKYYEDARRGAILLKEAEIGVKEAIHGKTKVGSPKWAWITQTILTFLGVVSIVISVGISIFK